MTTSPLASPRETADAPAPEGPAPAGGDAGVTRRATADRRVRAVLAALAFLLILASLTPSLGSGMRGDDSVVGIDLKGDLRYTDKTLATHIADTVEAGLENGRFMPVGVTQGLVYVAAVPERLPYKIGIVLLALGAVGMMLLFLRQLRLAALPTLLIVAVAFALSLQFRATHDPVLGYAGTSQLSMIILFTGLWAYVRYLQGASWRWYAFALTMAVALVLAYEANPPLVLAFLCLHFGRDPRRVHSWRAAVPFLALGGLMTLVMVFTRVASETGPSGYETSLELFTVAQVALRQALSGIPGLYFISGSQGLLSDPTRAEMLGALWRAGLLAGLLAIALLLVRATSATQRVRDLPAGTLPIAGVGFVLMSCSGLYISLAAQHQQLIGLGGGHLATFAGTMGFVLLAVAAFSAWGPTVGASRWAVAGLALAAGGLAFASQYSNLRIVAIEKPGIEQRELTRAALKQGVLDNVPPSTTIYINSRDLGWAFGNLIFYGGTIDYLAYLQTGREYDIRPDAPPPTDACPQVVEFPVQDCAEVSRTVAILAPRASRDGGSVIVAQGMPAGRVDQVGARRITVLARGVSAEQATPSLVGTLRDGRPWNAKRAAWTRSSEDDGWVRYETTLVGAARPLAWSLTDPRSPVNFANSTLTPGQSVRQFGTKHLLP